jgi:hypothetical protein
MRMSDGAGAGEAPTPLLASDEDFAAVLRDLADATSSLAAAARAKSRTIFPPLLAASPADTDLAVAVAGSGLETARVSLLLTYLGGTAAAKQLGTIGEPLPLLQVRLGADAAAADAADATTGAHTAAAAEAKLLRALLTHQIAPLILRTWAGVTSHAKVAPSMAPSQSTQSTGERDERRAAHSERERKEVAVAAAAAVAAAQLRLRD